MEKQLKKLDAKFPGKVKGIAKFSTPLAHGITAGGLVDTVKEGVTGFHMGTMNPDELSPTDVAAVTETCERAAAAFQTEAFDQMVESCIAQDLSWAKPAKKWEAALEE